MFIIAIHSRFEKKLYFVENVTIHSRNLNEKLEAQMFKAMHHYMGLSVDQSMIIHKVSKETSKGILKYIMKEF